MNTELILALVKIGAEIFVDERRDRFLKRYIKIKEEYQDELNKGINNWSDVKLNELLLDAERLGELVVAEHSKK